MKKHKENNNAFSQWKKEQEWTRRRIIGDKKWTSQVDLVGRREPLSRETMYGKNNNNNNNTI